jgi:hypothetical protein
MANRINRRPQFLLAQGKNNLLFGKFALFHGKTSFLAS